ncbi:hypothetical protein G7B40_041235 [Aetokthonos hydrillicola Thurmond2011]|jgi:hypothetical protein|uniref:Uncharacterized protein n=1 Tax=Aetokthonos hydrillicola Thurmond2011 TaxID=2712845 RepID=A0AAP5IHP8_9CYAN|nr:hypothetical protein [Aetokthonos hydrillicola]MBW4591144.1 hypothetical protein [Aetokthonos hydrillicola CCALA 1050]MDR9900912.1 hypothetical protein [Aetokthonos hydrillicola Thurmond2011]
MDYLQDADSALYTSLNRRILATNNPAIIKDYFSKYQPDDIVNFDSDSVWTVGQITSLINLISTNS